MTASRSSSETSNRFSACSRVMTTTCPRVAGLMSITATVRSSASTISLGMSPASTLQKMQSFGHGRPKDIHRVYCAPDDGRPGTQRPTPALEAGCARSSSSCRRSSGRSASRGRAPGGRMGVGALRGARRRRADRGGARARRVLAPAGPADGRRGAGWDRGRARQAGARRRGRRCRGRHDLGRPDSRPAPLPARDRCRSALNVVAEIGPARRNSHGRAGRAPRRRPSRACCSIPPSRRTSGSAGRR